MRNEDDKLGMRRPIARRDFLQGAALGLLGLSPSPAFATHADAAAQDMPGYYPPARLGMRGSHPGSFEAAHTLRDGKLRTDRIVETGETYDLVVVGGGISGLAAAHFFREGEGAGARILVLDNHDDFGGHAKRNEFHVRGRTLLLNGGTLGIESPTPYSRVADDLLKKLGIYPESLARACEHEDFYTSLGLKTSTFFDKETFGRDKLVVGGGRHADRVQFETFLSQSPLSADVRRDILRIQFAEQDYLPGLTSAQKKDRLSRFSYRDYLLEHVRATPGVVPYYLHATDSLWGCGIDAVSAIDCWGVGFPGFQGLKLEPGATARMGYTPAGYAATAGSYMFHYPDGNASIARLLVRNLCPDAMPGSDARDIVTARCNYANLDRTDARVRIRLNSTVIQVRNESLEPGIGGVDVVYVRDGKLARIRAKNCILACWNMMIPYLCPELPAAQKSALHKLIKTPLVYVSVVLRNWTPFAKLGVSRVSAPGCYFPSFTLNETVDIGGYESPRDPQEPILIRMQRTPARPGLNEREQHVAGRAELLATSFETFEREIRSQLARILGEGGFDPARDIEGIAVNRWPHGYAPEYNALIDGNTPLDQMPNLIGRKRFSRIAIANSDSGMAAYTDSAIDQAYRAVHELIGG